MRRAAKIDRNQPEIVKALRKAGAVVKHVHQVKKLFDIIVCYQGKTYCVEIKDGELPPSSRKLKEGEQECKDDFESVGVKYWIINSIDEALEMISDSICVCGTEKFCLKKKINEKWVCGKCHKPY